MNTNFNTTNQNGVYDVGINSAIDQYNLNGHIMIGRQDDPASNIDGAQRRLRLINSLVTIFEHDDPSTYEFMSFGIDKMQNSRIEEPQVEGHHNQETALHRFEGVYDDEKGGRLPNLDGLDTSFDSSRLGHQQLTQQHADDQNQGFRNRTDLPTVHNMLALESTEDDDCEFEIISPEDTERLWGILSAIRGGNDVPSQVQTILPLRNERQPVILNDNNNPHGYTSNGDLERSFYDTWDGTNFDDRMAGLSGSNKENIFGRGLLATEIAAGLEQLCGQYGIPDLANQNQECIRPSQFPQIRKQFTDCPESDGNWTSASDRVIPNDCLNADQSADHSMSSTQQKIQNFNSRGYESGTQNVTHGNQVPVPQQRSHESHQQGYHGPVPRKRTRTRGAKITTVQAGGMNVTEGLSDLEGRFEMDENNRHSHNPTKRNKFAKAKCVSLPRVEQRSYCMSRVSVSLEEMRAINPDYDKHPHRAFLPERMEFSQQAGMKTILIPTRMIDLLSAHRQKAREEERKNFTGRKIPRDFKLQPVRHKDFEAFQVARRKEEETRSYENRQRRFANSRS
ncbi:hypothetical protein BPAE_0765g00010 [Botrytis paeoniae]|uniref:Uncharacterized protein n=1 Tax=Botrytis paeoniae TaxID=278948 RepID=A0A4Z1EL50_9HELO|nr:hypothetical protein BPAE_0765g00010 [Botrytis paeoniae]